MKKERIQHITRTFLMTCLLIMSLMVSAHALDSLGQTGTSEVTGEKRALVIGYNEEKNGNYLEESVNCVGNLFSQNLFEDGVEVTKRYIPDDETYYHYQFIDLLEETFKDTTEDDLSFIFIAAHGAKPGGFALTQNPYDPPSDGSAYSWVKYHITTPAELRELLDTYVKGKVVLVLESCYSGNFILKSTPKSANDGREKTFQEAFVEEFIESGEDGKASDFSDGGNGKYKVLCSSDKEHSTYSRWFAKTMAKGLGWDENNHCAVGSMPADTSSDNKVTFAEMFSYIFENKKSYDGEYPVAYPEDDNTVVAEDYISLGNNFELKISQTKKLVPTYASIDKTSYEGATQKWESSNTDVATVDQEGNVTGIAEGNAEISVLINGKKGKVDVTVSCYTGECGDDATYKLHTDGTFEITGTGELWNYYTSETLLTSKIKKIKFGEGITKIGQAFTNCDQLESIEFPDSLVEIDNNAFYSCKKLKSVDIPKNVEKIGLNAFYDCSELKTVNLPDKLVSIGQSAFASCTKLESISIPNKVKTIEQETFANCTGLKDVYIPKSVESIVGNAFYGCYQLNCHLDCDPTNNMDGLKPWYNKLTMYYPCDNNKWTAEVKAGFSEESWEREHGALEWVMEHTHLIKTEATEASCKGAGNKEYWTCGCGKHFKDTNCTEEYSDDEIVIPKTDHSYGALIPSVAATCKKTGTKAHYKCSVCNKIFDENKRETSIYALLIKAKGHSLTSKSAKGPTCSRTGNYAYWHCDTCDKYFKDSLAKKEYGLNAWVIPKVKKLSNFSLKQKKKKIYITWKKSTDKTPVRYVLMRSTKKSKGYKTIATLKTSTTKCTNSKDLKKKKRYYYKIRAKVSIGSKYVYVDVVSPKSIKFKK